MAEHAVGNRSDAQTENPGTLSHVYHDQADVFFGRKRRELIGGITADHPRVNLNARADIVRQRLQSSLRPQDAPVPMRRQVGSVPRRRRGLRHGVSEQEIGAEGAGDACGGPHFRL